MERMQVSHGRTIRVMSVFPENGLCSPEDKLKALIDLEIQQEKLCAESQCCLGKALDIRAALEYYSVAML